MKVGQGYQLGFGVYVPPTAQGLLRTNKRRFKSHNQTLYQGVQTVLNHTFRHYIRANKPRFKSRIQILYQGEQTPF